MRIRSETMACFDRFYTHTERLLESAQLGSAKNKQVNKHQ